jgi:hypothetical protein
MPGVQLCAAGEIVSAEEAEGRRVRVRAALRVLYRVGEATGQRRLCGIALDAMNAARGLL